MSTVPCPRRALDVVGIALVVLAVAPACRTGAPAQTAANLDRDGDGVRDDADLCPDSPEDRDGFDDWDGCPEAGDGGEVSWRLPGVDAGQPEPPRAIDSDGDGAAIRGDTAAILDSIAAFILDRPGGVQGVTIEGRAEAYERDPPALSAARTKAVHRYLIKRGVPARLIQTPLHANNPLRSLIGGDDNGRRSRRRVDLNLMIAR